MTSEDESIVGLRNLATGKVRRIPVETIEDRINKGTANAGFTNSLTRELPRDLIAWLASMNATVRSRGGDRDLPHEHQPRNYLLSDRPTQIDHVSSL